MTYTGYRTRERYVPYFEYIRVLCCFGHTCCCCTALIFGWRNKSREDKRATKWYYNVWSLIHHFLGHISLTRSQNASFHQTCESAQITCDRILWTASQVTADSGASLVRLVRPRESSPLIITLASSWIPSSGYLLANASSPGLRN